jgi:16S rRNA (guanine527-N7)-methyltransferase
MRSGPGRPAKGAAVTGRGGAPPESGFVEELLGREGIALPAGAAGKLVLHAAEMLRWNRSIRLTAIVRPDEVAVKHILDSLLLLRFAPFGGSLLDFGSGAGYPGIPLGIALPDLRVVLLEASAKKCAFLAEAVRKLSLGNVEVVHGRLGGSPPPPPLGPFEQIATRATLPPAEAAALLLPLLAPGGRLLLMTGPGRRGGAGVRLPLPEGAAPGRRLRFSLPLGMGSREILELRAP